jgi:hypothetical protein
LGTGGSDTVTALGARRLGNLGQEFGFGIAAGLAPRTRDEPTRDRCRDDREQREPAEEEERGDGTPGAVLWHDVAVPDGRHGLECPPQPQPHGGEGLTGEEVLDEGTVEDAAADAT